MPLKRKFVVASGDTCTAVDTVPQLALVLQSMTGDADTVTVWTTIVEDPSPVPAEEFLG